MELNETELSKAIVKELLDYDGHVQKFVDNIIKAVKANTIKSEAILLQTIGEPYTIFSILKHLADAAWILLYKKDYDGKDWEEIEHCYKKAREIIEKSGLSFNS